MTDATTGMSKRRRKRAKLKPGAAPGTIEPAPDAARTVVRVMAYGPEDLEEREITDLDQIAPLCERFQVVWVDVRGLGDVDLLKRLAEMFDVHDLTLEDVVTQSQQAKVEEHGDALYFVVPAPLQGDLFEAHQLDVFVRPGLVCTFQEQGGGWLEPVRNRIRSGRLRIRRTKADYLAYAIIDTIVDHYFPVVESFGDRIEDLEQHALEAPTKETNVLINRIRQDLLRLRRTVTPIRDALATIVKDDLPSVSDETRLFFRDCHDHAVQIVTAIEFERERARGLVDLVMASISNRMNEVMKVLTIIATIFIPLGFVAGVYGMNFDREASPFNMPELGWRFGYLGVLGLMVAAAAVLLLYFRARGWIGSSGNRDRTTKHGN